MGTQGKRIDETGNVYGRLTVIEFSYIKKTNSGGNQTIWLCRCECGHTMEVRAGDLRRKDERAIRSCAQCSRTKHGHTAKGWQSPEYASWHNMKTRCQRDENYTSRNITVCERWQDSFENFLDDMGLQPGPGYTIERKDNNKGYEPDNCKWATRSEQMRNTRHSKLITINGETKNLFDWLAKLGVNISTYYTRIWSGMTPEEALTMPVKKYERTKEES